MWKGHALPHGSSLLLKIKFERKIAGLLWRNVHISDIIDTRL